METKIYSLERMVKSIADNLKQFLHDSGIESSRSDGRTWHGEPMLWHFCIRATPNQVDAINNWLDANLI